MDLSIRSVLHGSLILAVGAFLAGCGSSSQNSTTPTAASPTASPNPTASPIAQNICTSQTLAANVKVYYSGQTGSGTPFTDPTQSYVGVVVNVFNNGQAVVNFPSLNATYEEPFSLLMPEATCTQSLIGVQVLYVGAASTNFPNVATQIYMGVIDDVFAGANAEVHWNNLTNDFVVPFTDIAIAEPTPTPTPSATPTPTN